jgi:hypothetical protein
VQPQRPGAAAVAAVGCLAHTGWAALVVVAGGVTKPEVLIRGRAELADPTGHVRRNVYQSARGLDPAAAAPLVEAAERIAAERAAAALEQSRRDAAGKGADVGSCAVVAGAFREEVRLESILTSHALAHAAEGRLYQQALLRGAESCGLVAVAVPKRSIWEQAQSTFRIAQDELRQRIDELRGELGSPWAQDQKLAALAAWLALAEPHPGLDDG